MCSSDLELTHIDVWGKFETVSIDRYQYFIGFVDDHGRYITMEGLKKKLEAAQKVKNYITYLCTQDMKPKAVRFDVSGEFLATELREWLKQEGFIAQPTTPYSPSQNGVAEHMNRTLAELAQAMVNARNLPLFLWE